MSSISSRARLAALALGVVVLAVGCGSGSSSTPSPNPATALPTAAPPATGSPSQLYVSIGDSYAAGYQPFAPKKGVTTRNGFAYQVVDAARAKGYDLKLVNLGCGGATTQSLLTSPGCRADMLGPGGVQYTPKTQADAAEEFLKAHRGEVALITVSIGGNDITACGKAADAVSCATAAIASIKTNLTTLLSRLRAAAGPTTRIVGTTYPDVILGEYLSPDPQKKQTAALSVTAFRSLVNPTLKAGYAAVGGTFVDVTAATGAYGSMEDTTTLDPYGQIPVPVAKVCQLTFYCQFGDIHPRTAGYTVISDLVVGTLPRRSA